MVRHTKVAHLTSAHGVVHRRQRILQWYRFVGHVYDVEVDVVGLQTLQTMIELSEHMRSGESTPLRPGRHRVGHLRRQNDGVPPIA